jgi:hypothetical protein
MPTPLEIIIEDLAFLYTISMKWDAEFATQIDRFQAVKGEAVNHEFANAYWLPDWITAMVFRTYLTSVDAPFQILIDNADGIDPYVVLCNWEF